MKEDIINMIIETTIDKNNYIFSVENLMEILPYSKIEIISSLNFLLFNNIISRDNKNNDFFKFNKKIKNKDLNALMFLNINFKNINKLKERMV